MPMQLNIEAFIILNNSGHVTNLGHVVAPHLVNSNPRRGGADARKG
jgi:hypothetical protein